MYIWTSAVSQTPPHCATQKIRGISSLRSTLTCRSLSRMRSRSPVCNYILVFLAHAHRKKPLSLTTSLSNTSPSLPITSEQMQHLPMRHGILARCLQDRAIHKIQYDRMWQLLAVQVRRIGYPEFTEMIFLHRSLLHIHSLRDGEDEVTVGVDLDYATLPQLYYISFVLVCGEWVEDLADLPVNRGTEH